MELAKEENRVEGEKNGVGRGGGVGLARRRIGLKERGMGLERGEMGSEEEEKWV